MTVSRREVLKSLGGGCGTLALAGVMRDARLLAAEPGTTANRHGHTLAPRDGHFTDPEVTGARVVKEVLA